jgi:hypothetical protein
MARTSGLDGWSAVLLSGDHDSLLPPIEDYFGPPTMSSSDPRQVFAMQTLGLNFTTLGMPSATPSSIDLFQGATDCPHGPHGTTSARASDTPIMPWADDDVNEIIFDLANALDPPDANALDLSLQSEENNLTSHQVISQHETTGGETEAVPVALPAPAPAPQPEPVLREVLAREGPLHRPCGSTYRACRTSTPPALWLRRAVCSVRRLPISEGSMRARGSVPTMRAPRPPVHWCVIASTGIAASSRRHHAPYTTVNH